MHRHSRAGRNPEGKGGAAPFACVRGREQAKRCERGMHGAGTGAWQASIPLAPLRKRRGEYEHPPNPLTLTRRGDGVFMECLADGE